MPTLRERIVKRVLRPELEQMDRHLRTVLDAYTRGPFEEMTTPEALFARLREQTGDAAAIRDMIDQVYWEEIGTMTGYGADTDRQRTRAVNESRRQWRWDVIAQQIIWLWTNYGFGEDIIIRTEDPEAQTTWDEFWKADRNQSVLAPDKIHQLSHNLLRDGELFFPFYISTVDGECKIRTIDPKEITGIVTEKDDKSVPQFYHRVWSPQDGSVGDLYYPDWLAALNAKQNGDEIGNDQRVMGTVSTEVLGRGMKVAKGGSQTNVMLLPVFHNVKEGLRGWPLMAAGAAWTRAHKQFRENRASVSAAIAMYVNKLKVTAGSRGIDALRSQIQSSMVTSGQTYETNPQAPAGSTWLENQGADLSRMSLSTAAGDAKVDGEGLLLMAGLSGGIYPHYLGAGDAYRLATSISMEAPLFRLFSRYQSFWAAQFRKMVRIVLETATVYGKKTFTSYGAEVSTDRLVETDLVAIAGSIHNIIHAIFVPAVENGLMPKPVAQKILAALWRIVLEALQVRNAVDIASDDEFMRPGNPVAQVAQAVQRNVEEGRVTEADALKWAMRELLSAGSLLEGKDG